MTFEVILYFLNKFHFHNDSLSNKNIAKKYESLNIKSPSVALMSLEGIQRKIDQNLERI